MTTVTVGTSSSYTFTGADSIALTLAQGTQARVSVTSSAGVQKYSCAVTESRTIGPFSTGDVFSVTAARGSIDYATLFGNATTLSAAYTLRKEDDQQSFECTTALTISVPDGLSPRPTVTIKPPPSGNVTVQMTGAETVNSGASVARGRSSNPGGFVLSGNKDAATYAATGT